MSFANAYQKAKVKQRKDSNIPIPTQEDKDDDNNNDDNNWEPTNPELVPMMYRAQVQGRCSLQYGNNKQDLNRWTEEWVYPNPKQQDTPSYQYAEPKLGLDGLVYRLKVDFPFRVFSNCGQDSILRPTIGKNGIPFIPGSGIKGLFERLSRDSLVSKERQQKVREYCGNPEEPGTLRFHGAYPVGDWAGTKTVTPKNKPAETRYRLVDVVHPQQKRQIQREGSPQAIAIVSFYQPNFIFELSSIKPLAESEWETIAGLLRQALRPGLGGKTSTGYGLYALPQNRYPLDIKLQGKGVSPLLRSDEPEFRPNLFKASLKGHFLRLLAGVCGDERAVQAKVDRLFGHTTEPGVLKLYWESEFLKNDQTLGNENTPIYETKGKLYLDAPKQDLPFVQKVMEFAFNMGGFGKSWRRVWHDNFLPSYKTRAIGCHWTCQYQYSNFEPTAIKNPYDLKAFLTELHEAAKDYMGVKASERFQTSSPDFAPPKSSLKRGTLTEFSPLNKGGRGGAPGLKTSPNLTQCLPWKEAWCPERLSVYTQVVSQSKAIELFHEPQFKTTPAIGGRKLGDPGPTSISFVWHRMLPLDGNQYLEIITLFHGGKSGSRAYSWQRNGENQLPLFTQQLNDLGFELKWGNPPPI